MNEPGGILDFLIALDEARVEIYHTGDDIRLWAPHWTPPNLSFLCWWKNVLRSKLLARLRKHKGRLPFDA